MNVAISEASKIEQQEVVAEYQDLEVLQTCEYEAVKVPKVAAAEHWVLIKYSKSTKESSTIVTSSHPSPVH